VAVVPAPDSPHRVHGRRYTLFVAALVAAIVVSFCASVSIGAFGVALGDVLRVLGRHIAPWATAGPPDPVVDQIVWELRAPRALLSLVVGSGLAVAGCILQAVVRNPLADPYVLGAVSGASFGAVAVIVAGSAAVGGLGLSAAAFLGAMLSLAAVFVLGRHAGRFSPTRLVLAGIALAYLFSAATSYLQIHGDPNELRAVVFWLLGSVADAEFGDLPVVAAVVVVTTGWLLLQTRSLNSLLVGDESAYALGVDVSRFRAKLIIASALLTGAVVAVAGGIVFVGLMIPHVARLLVGPDHRRVIPVSVLLGATYLAWIDILSRTLEKPAELPLGILTAVIGAPFFLTLMYRSSRVAGVG
jgi:iron complex transport system permease protein